jgi:hypothetical protein
MFFSSGGTLTKILTHVKVKGKDKDKVLIYKIIYKTPVNVVQSILEELEDHWISESVSTVEIG